MDLKETLTKLVEEGNVARASHIREIDSPGGLHHAAVWLDDRVKADFKGFLAKRILTDLNTNEEKKVAKCHLDAFLEQVLSNEHRCHSSDKFLDALAEAKRQVLCDMVKLLKPFVSETS